LNLGFALPHVGPVATPANIALAAREAETIGYRSLWTLERVLTPVVQKTPYPPAADGRLNSEYRTVYEPLTVLAHVAGLTTAVRLGVSVINLPFYNPVMLGRQIATLDQLSEGRVELGVGVGWSEDEFAVTNSAFNKRGRVAEEILVALKAVWGPDPVEFHGEHFDIPTCWIGPKPKQHPHPPILIGGFAPLALDRAARLGDGFTGCCQPATELIANMKHVKDTANSLGRPTSGFRTVMRCLVSVTPEPIVDQPRPLGTGSWDHIRHDVLELSEAGVDEVFFDVAFQRDVTDQRMFLLYMNRFRGILDASVAS
jgi:probable F420-dependent oxidoreductase